MFGLFRAHSLRRTARRAQRAHSERVTRELAKLDEIIAHRGSSPAPELLEVVDHRALWAIQLDGGGTCFMCARSVAINDEMFVVYVDANRFYRAWLAGRGQQRNDGCPLREDMPSDRKYQWAVAGFAGGRENPVPLADAGGYLEGGEPRISFINGVTRTMWLLANQARSFPVSVTSERSARELYETAGVGGRAFSRTELFRGNVMSFDHTVPAFPK